MTRRYIEERKFKEYPHQRDVDMDIINAEIEYENSLTLEGFKEYGLEDPPTNWNDLWDDEKERHDITERFPYPVVALYGELSHKDIDDLWTWFGERNLNSNHYTWTISAEPMERVEEITFWFRDKDIATQFKMRWA